MSPRVPLVAASLVLAAAGLLALDPAVPLSQYGHDAWTSDSGLPQNSITTSRPCSSPRRPATAEASASSRVARAS